MGSPDALADQIARDMFPRYDVAASGNRPLGMECRKKVAEAIRIGIQQDRDVLAQKVLALDHENPDLQWLARYIRTHSYLAGPIDLVRTFARERLRVELAVVDDRLWQQITQGEQSGPVLDQMTAELAAKLCPPGTTQAAHAVGGDEPAAAPEE